MVRTLCPTAVEYILFPSAHGTLGHETSQNKFQMIQNMFSGHKGIKLDIKNEKLSEKFPSIWKLSNSHLKTNHVSKKISWGKLGKYFDLNENKNMTYKNMWGVAKAMFRGKFIAL